MSGRSRLLHFTKGSADGSGVGITHSIGGDEMDVDFEAAAGEVEVAARMHGRGALVWCSTAAARGGGGAGAGGAQKSAVHLATRGRRLAARLGAIRVLQKGRTSRRNGMGRGGTGLLYCTSGT